jgi:aminopeptidase
MFDPRWAELADILVSYSTRTSRGDKLLITMMEQETFPLTVAVYEAAVRAGAFPQVQFASAYLERALLQHGSDELIARVPDLEWQGLTWADTYIGLRGARNPHEFTGIPPRRLIAHKRAMGQVSTLRNQQTRWVLVRVPNEAFAQQAAMSLEETMALFFQATLRDWAAEGRRYDRIRERFQASQKVRITGSDTDLSFSTAGRTYVVGDGRINIPDGEIYTAPIDDSAEGYIAFDFPASYAGQTIAEIRLEFHQGEVIRASASKGEAVLREALASDPGARRIGEFGVGVNTGIDRFTGDVVFDEKIAGTIHVALGRAYAECGGTNQSALHWDLVKDLRTEGAIELDGQTIIVAGEFVEE